LKRRNRLERLERLGVGLLAVLLLLEEWLWDALGRGMRRLALALHLKRFEAALRALPAWASLAVLSLPALVLLPFKLLAFWAMSHGHAVLGFLTFVGAKLTGTALAAYLFDLVRDNARKLRWFDQLYTAVMSLLRRAKTWLHAQPLYQATRAKLQAWRMRWAGAPGAPGGSRWARRFAALRAAMKSRSSR
jgi:hypothetical protein